MKRFFIWFLLLFLPILSYSQSRTVKGCVLDANKQPLPNAVVAPMGSKDAYKVESIDGSFSILVSSSITSLVAYCEGYSPMAVEIDGSYLIFILQKDIAAEIAKRKAAEKERRAAEARAEKERREAEARAKKEAEEKAKAEENARLEAERQARAEERAKIRTAHKAKEDKYDQSFKNKGLEHSIDLSYSYQTNVSCKIPYRYSGYRDYNALHPFGFNYILYYRWNRLFAVGAGAGALFNARSISIGNDSFAPPFDSFKEQRLDVPVFAALKVTPFRSKFRPMLNGTAGYFMMTKLITWGIDLGGEFRFTKNAAIHFCIGAQKTPYPIFDLDDNGNDYYYECGYETVVSPTIKIGISF